MQLDELERVALELDSPETLAVATTTRRIDPPLRLALDASSAKWQEQATHCSACGVELSSTLKQTRRRHCRCCGEIFCHLCTYDKAPLMKLPSTLVAGCLPCLVPRVRVHCHVCTSCYDELPPPADRLRRCRFCSNKVRLHVYGAHVSVCEERHRPAGAGGPSSRLLPERAEASAAPLRRSSSTPSLRQLGVAAPAPNTAAGPPPAPRQEQADELPQALLCKICLTHEANAFIRKCGHALACVYCVEKCDTCPICRQPIKEVLRIFRQ
jgi:hypothetical protein